MEGLLIRGKDARHSKIQSCFFEILKVLTHVCMTVKIKVYNFNKNMPPYSLIYAGQDMITMMIIRGKMAEGE